MQFIYICESSDVFWQMRVLEGEIDMPKMEVVYTRKLLSNPNSMRSCLDSLIFEFPLWPFDIPIEEIDLLRKAAQYRGVENDSLILRKSIPRDT